MQGTCRSGPPSSLRVGDPARGAAPPRDTVAPSPRPSVRRSSGAGIVPIVVGLLTIVAGVLTNVQSGSDAALDGLLGQPILVAVVVMATDLVTTAATVTPVALDRVGRVGFEQHAAGLRRIADGAPIIGGLIRGSPTRSRKPRSGPGEPGPFQGRHHPHPPPRSSGLEGRRGSGTTRIVTSPAASGDTADCAAASAASRSGVNIAEAGIGSAS